MTDLQKKQYWHTQNLRRQTLLAAHAAVGAGSSEESGPSLPFVWGTGKFKRQIENYGIFDMPFDADNQRYIDEGGVYAIYKNDTNPPTLKVTQAYDKSQIIKDNIEYATVFQCNVGETVNFTYVPEN